jgi:hypothetical protein
VSLIIKRWSDDRKRAVDAIKSGGTEALEAIVEEWEEPEIPAEAVKGGLDS